MKGVRVLNGYRLLYRPEHFHCMASENWRGYVYEHVYVMEVSLQRVLEETEVVHHLDGNRQNNHLGNLIVMDRGMHLKLHTWIDNGAPIHESYRRNGMNSGKSKVAEPKFCVICQSCLQGKQKKTCSEGCESLRKRKVERPSFEQLKEDVHSISLLSVGRKYGVSDNAVRKWLKAYGYYDNPEPS